MSQLIVEADGGSRGNPGPAAFGALLREGQSGRIIARIGETIGTATNNVAEYRGLIAGLELAREHGTGAPVEVRMDSKLVIEQMAGRWKIKHPDMQDLAARARALCADLGSVTWTWVPRAENSDADSLVNEALDTASGLANSGDPVVEPAVKESPAKAPSWQAVGGEATTLYLVRHGVTPFTERKLFSGSGGEDPPLTDRGREQADAAGQWLARHGDIDVLVASPLLRTQQTAEQITRHVDVPVETLQGITEISFGDWDGLSFGDISKRWPNEMSQWLKSTSVAPPRGESFDAVSRRVKAALEMLQTTYAGKRVAVVSHVTPIKVLVAEAVGAPLESLYSMELMPASVSMATWWGDGRASLQGFNVVPWRQ